MVEKGWQHAHEIVKKIKAVNMTKAALEETLGVVLGMLSEGGKDYTDIKRGADLMISLRQDNGVEGFLAEMKDLEKELITDETCEWSEDEDGNWGCSKCTALWMFPELGPGENEMIYCPECGRKIVKINPYVEETREEE